jgi:hypothetical protein
MAGEIIAIFSQSKALAYYTVFLSYGFSLDESNPYNTLHFRVIIGTHPKQAINHVTELMPD